MRYLQRDKTGAVIGHYANPHDYAMELVADDHPDLLAYKEHVAALKNPPHGVLIDADIRRSTFNKSLLRVLAKHLKTTEAKLLKELKEE